MDFKFDFSLTVDKLVQPAAQSSRALGTLTAKLEAAASSINKLDPLVDKLSSKLAGLRDAFGKVGAGDSGLQKLVRSLEHVSKASTSARSRNETNMRKIADDWQKMAEKAESAEARKTKMAERAADQRIKAAEREAAAAVRLAEKQQKAADKAARKPYYGGHKSISELLSSRADHKMSGMATGAADWLLGLPGRAIGGAISGVAGLAGSAVNAGIGLAGDAGNAAFDFGKRGISGQALRENSVAGFDAIFGDKTNESGNGKQSTYSVGDKLFDQAVRIAKLTKFDTPDVVEAFNTLAASGFSKENLPDVFSGYADVSSARGEGYAKRYGTGLAKLNAQQNATFASFQQAAMAGPGLKLAEQTLAKRLGMDTTGDIDSQLRDKFRNKKISGQSAIEGVLFATSERYDQGGKLGGYARKQGEGTWEGLLSNIKNGLNDVLTMKLDPGHPMMKFKGLLIEVNKLFDEQTDRGQKFQSLMTKVLEDVFKVFNISPDQSGKAIDNMLDLATELEKKLSAASDWINEHITKPLASGAGTEEFVAKLKTTLSDIGGVIGEGIYWGIKNAAIQAVKSSVTFLAESANDDAIKGPADYLAQNYKAPDVPHMASGGTVTRPTLALIGEGGEAEHVIPDSKLRSMGGGGIHFHGDVVLQMPGGGGGMGAQEYGQAAADAFMQWLGTQVRNPGAGSVRG